MVFLLFFIIYFFFETFNHKSIGHVQSAILFQWVVKLYDVNGINH